MSLDYVSMVTISVVTSSIRTAGILYYLVELRVTRSRVCRWVPVLARKNVRSMATRGASGALAFRDFTIKIIFGIYPSNLSCQLAVSTSLCR